MPSRRQPDRITLSLRVPSDLAARLRVFVRDNAGKPLYLTLSSFTEAAIEAHLEATERRLADDAQHRRPNSIDNNRR